MLTKIIKINPNSPEEDLINEAADVLQKGGLVAFPTETVYGIGANLLDKDAINRLYELKKRPKDKPFSIHIARFETLKDLELDLSDRATRIIHKFWPGPLTIVAFNRNKEKLGVRMPRNNVALALLRSASVPVVAPSANISGRRPPTSAKEVVSELDGSIDIIIDGGTTEVGIESTVLDVTAEPFKVLREGAISKEDLVTDYNVLFVCTGNSCRSVMAKGILEKFLKEAKLSDRVKVDSAGTFTYSGMSAAPNTIEVMKEEGMDVSKHKGKPVTPDLLKKSDIIFVMEKVHKDNILSKVPEISYKVRLLKEDGEVPDPIGKSIFEYRSVRDIIKDNVENLFLELREKLK